MLDESFELGVICDVCSGKANLQNLVRYAKLKTKGGLTIRIYELSQFRVRGGNSS